MVGLQKAGRVALGKGCCLWDRGAAARPIAGKPAPTFTAACARSALYCGSWLAGDGARSGPGNLKGKLCRQDTRLLMLASP